jgi:K+ transporter
VAGSADIGDSSFHAHGYVEARSVHPSQRQRDRSLPIDLFLSDVARRPQARVPGTAVFMTGSAEGIPPALLHNLKHNKILHEQVILLTVATRAFRT